MTASIANRYLECYEDPRPTAGFDAGHYPVEAEGGEDVPVGVEEAKGRFKAVYARRNACIVALGRLAGADPGRAAMMERVLFLTEAIDHLEDAYAPIGLMAEPVMDDTMFTRELLFTHARKPVADGPVVVSSFSIYIPIPLEEPGEGGRLDAP